MHERRGPDQAAITARGQRDGLGRQGFHPPPAQHQGGQVLADRHRDPDGQRSQNGGQQHGQTQPPEDAGRLCAHGGGGQADAPIPTAKGRGQRQPDIGQHKDQMCCGHGGRTPFGAQMQCHDLKPRQKGHLRHDEGQIDQPCGANRAAATRFRLQRRQGQRQRAKAGGKRNGKGGGALLCKVGRGLCPCFQAEGLGQGIGKLPKPGERPQGQPRHARGKAKGDHACHHPSQHGHGLIQRAGAQARRGQHRDQGGKHPLGPKPKR